MLVHGAMSDHSNDAPFAARLGASFTTFAMDRRGRGASGDSDDYAIDREFEDVAAVAEAVSAQTERPVAVWGHSFGADCAIGAAALTRDVQALILYEPGLGYVYPPGAIEAVEEALKAGDREAAATALMSRVVGMTGEEVEFVRSLPTWKARLQIVPTVPREVRAEAGWVYQPGRFDAIRASCVILAGSESPPQQTAATRRAARAIPNAQVLVLEGHGHIAHRTDPELVVGIVTEFLR